MHSWEILHTWVIMSRIKIQYKLPRNVAITPDFSLSRPSRCSLLISAILGRRIELPKNKLYISIIRPVEVSAVDAHKTAKLPQQDKSNSLAILPVFRYVIIKIVSTRTKESTQFALHRRAPHIRIC